MPVFSSYRHLLFMGWCLDGFRFLGTSGGPTCMISKRHAAPSPGLPLLFVISFTTLRPEARRRELLRITRRGLSGPSRGSRTHRFPLFACSKKYRDDDNVRTYTVTTWWTDLPSAPLVSLPPLSNRVAMFVWGPDSWAPSKSPRLCTYESNCNYTIFRHYPLPPPWRGGRFLVVVTHVHGGRSAPPGAEAFREPIGRNSFTLTFSWSVLGRLKRNETMVRRYLPSHPTGPGGRITVTDYLRIRQGDCGYDN
jgi:hypothetical protein